MKVKYIECVLTLSSYSEDSEITSDVLKTALCYDNKPPEMRDLVMLLLQNLKLNLNHFYGGAAVEELAKTLGEHLPNLLTVCAPEGEKE